ncbi:hypothetical protein M434DRAFT_212868 [Hypoxylon sp. CO27-5]|nr:hypothetical protein M434DRAFT_212868 [Hypoxylon sp. CO27-5]
MHEVNGDLFKGRLDLLAGLLSITSATTTGYIWYWLGDLADSVASHREEFLGRESNTSFSQACLTVIAHTTTYLSFVSVTCIVDIHHHHDMRTSRRSLPIYRYVIRLVLMQTDSYVCWEARINLKTCIYILQYKLEVTYIGSNWCDYVR